jgi:hypothetical protein
LATRVKLFSFLLFALIACTSCNKPSVPSTPSFSYRSSTSLKSCGNIVHKHTADGREFLCVELDPTKIKRHGFQPINIDLSNSTEGVKVVVEYWSHAVDDPYCNPGASTAKKLRVWHAKEGTLTIPTPPSSDITSLSEITFMLHNVVFEDEKGNKAMLRDEAFYNLGKIRMPSRK